MGRLAIGVVVVLLTVASPGSARNDDWRPSPGTPIFILSIPVQHLKMVVVEGEPPNNEDGYQPTHYRTTVWPGDGETVGISAHHFTHHSALAPVDGGPFRHIDWLRPGDQLYLTMLPKYGGKTYVYHYTGQKPVYCGPSGWDAWNCPNISKAFAHIHRNHVVLTTCIGDAHQRRAVYFYPGRGSVRR
jgi:sortase (surface protein transpeptidase)